MSGISAEELARVNSFPKLVALLRDKLEWPIDEDYEFEDVIFEYDPHELGLKEEETAKVREIHQLRPLVTNQPWGVFFISFEEKQLSVTVLRRILRALVVKQRGGAVDRQAWEKSDLIFAANFGKSGERELAFVHFSDGAETGDLPVMKVLGWNAKDTKLHTDHVGYQLSKQLSWPDDPADIARWRSQWAGAFEVRHREVISTSIELAKRLAALAREIRARVNQLLQAEADDGPMRTMLEAFRKNLIHDLDADGFADMFAQTICYGMLAAAISKSPNEHGTGALIADNLADMIPRTNPFLKELFGNFLKIGGRDKRSRLDFDELGVRDVVDMLNLAKMDRVLEDFGNRNPKKDPVIHFYEDFLREYDREQKVDAGIFYTPPAVVGFIVRSVDEMLREQFALPLGLADTSTWEEVASRNDKIATPDGIDPKSPFVQILDPATGTGTFLVETIDLIHKRMIETWTKEGKTPAQIKDAWNAYVPAHLLTRLNAFELKMAAYAIAHMKIGLKLSETGYTFGSNERLHILLTNSLQPARDLDLEERMRLEAMAHEAERANEAKEKIRFTVVIGNPPYKGESMNPSKVMGKLTFAGEIIQRFFQVRGEPLGEKNPKWLNNDYVKFIAFGMRQVEKSGAGVLGFITSNTWLDRPTFRGVRTAIIDSFPLLRLVDLHGNVGKREVASDGTRDEGVFAIEEGTAILVAGKILLGPSIKQRDILGKLGEGAGDKGKLSWLEEHNIRDASNLIVPLPPFFQLTPMKSSTGGENSFLSEFYALEAISNIMPLNGAGIITKRDALSIDMDAEVLLKRVELFLNTPPENIHSVFSLPEDVRDWRVEWAKADIAKHPPSMRYVKPISYRPFDSRFIYYTGVTRGFIGWPTDRVMRHMLEANNVALITARSNQSSSMDHFFCSDQIVETKCGERTAQSTTFPLWLAPAANEPHRRPNIDRTWADGVGAALGLVYEDGIPRGQQASLGTDFIKPKVEQIELLDKPWDGRGDLTKTFGPRDLFDYIYAVLHAPGYRTRYAEFLRSDFPRIPMPESRELFADLIPLGRELIALHLLKSDEASELKNPDIRLAGTGDARVEKGYPKYENGKVNINASRWFEDVPRATWEFHIGGYQPSQKWLKDRAGKGGENPRPGRLLSDDDILHYRRVITALTETRKIMAEIDEAIEKHGGWPGAFSIGGVPAKAA